LPQRVCGVVWTHLASALESLYNAWNQPKKMAEWQGRDLGGRCKSSLDRASRQDPSMLGVITPFETMTEGQETRH